MSIKVSNILWQVRSFACHHVNQTRSHGVANATSGQQDTFFFSPLENFYAIFYCCLIYVDKERSPGILVRLNHGLCDIIEKSILSCTHILRLIVVALCMK